MFKKGEIFLENTVIEMFNRQMDELSQDEQKNEQIEEMIKYFQIVILGKIEDKLPDELLENDGKEFFDITYESFKHVFLKGYLLGLEFIEIPNSITQLGDILENTTKIKFYQEMMAYINNDIDSIFKLVCTGDAQKFYQYTLLNRFENIRELLEQIYTEIAIIAAWTALEKNVGDYKETTEEKSLLLNYSKLKFNEITPSFNVLVENSTNCSEFLKIYATSVLGGGKPFLDIGSVIINKYSSNEITEQIKNKGILFTFYYKEFLVDDKDLFIIHYNKNRNILISNRPNQLEEEKIMETLVQTLENVQEIDRSQIKVIIN